MCPKYRLSNFDPGGFSEYLKFDKWNIERGGLLKIPSKMTFEEASFIEPLACCIRGLKRINIQKNEAVAILGLGTIGILFLQLLKIFRFCIFFFLLNFFIFSSESSVDPSS